MPKGQYSTVFTIITTLNIHDNKSHNAYKNECIAVAFTKRSGTDKRTNKHMDGQMNKKANARTDEQSEASCPNTIVCGE